MKKEEILNAYCRIRTIDNTISDDVLNFMKNTSIQKLENQEFIKEKLMEVQNLLLSEYQNKGNGDEKYRTAMWNIIEVLRKLNL